MMEEKIYEILTEIRPEFNFHESEDFVEDGYLDSFDVVTIVDAIEQEYGIIIDGLEVLPENFSSVESICELIKKSGGR